MSALALWAWESWGGGHSHALTFFFVFLLLILLPPHVIWSFLFSSPTLHLSILYFLRLPLSFLGFYKSYSHALSVLSQIVAGLVLRTWTATIFYFYRHSLFRVAG
ncbi:hypothetical protein GGI43DRAFT_290152 [Trichoderma evansii]